MIIRSDYDRIRSDTIECKHKTTTKNNAKKRQRAKQKAAVCHVTRQVSRQEQEQEQDIEGLLLYHPLIVQQEQEQEQEQDLRFYNKRNQREGCCCHPKGHMTSYSRIRFRVGAKAVVRVRARVAIRAGVKAWV